MELIRLKHSFSFSILTDQSESYVRLSVTLFFISLCVRPLLFATVVKVLSKSLQRIYLSGVFQISGIMTVSFSISSSKDNLCRTSRGPSDRRFILIRFVFQPLPYFYPIYLTARQIQPLKAHLSIIVCPRHGCYYSFSILLFTRFGLLSFLETYEILFLRGLSLLYSHYFFLLKNSHLIYLVQIQVFPIFVWWKVYILERTTKCHLSSFHTDTENLFLILFYFILFTMVTKLRNVIRITIRKGIIGIVWIHLGSISPSINEMVKLPNVL